MKRPPRGGRAIGAPARILLLALWGWLPACQKPAPPPRPPVPVTAAEAETASVPIDVPAVGTVQALQTVSVRAQVSGPLDKVEFEAGQDVEAGQVLMRIDPRPYRIALRQAQAALERDKVQAVNAEQDAARYKVLASKNYVTQEQYASLRASAKAQRALVAVDQAAVDQARLNLDYCTIRAPIAGRTGDRLVDPGNLVQANGTTALVVINQVEPIEVHFSVPQKQLSATRKAFAEGSAVVTVQPADGAEPLTGRLTFIDNAVSTSTGTIMLKAHFDNPAHRLWPGQFVPVTLRLGTLEGALVVPSQAIQTGQKGKYVFVIGPDRTARMQSVTTGPAFEDRTVVETGLRAGERVVVDGQLRLTDGAKVEIEQNHRAPRRGTM